MGKLIGIDVYSALHSPRGMGVYTINLLKELAKIDKENTFILYGDIDDFNNVLPIQENFIYKKLNANGLFHYEQFVLPQECKKDNISILHSPANTSPFFLDKNIKRIITQHDLIFLKKEIPLPYNKRQLLGRVYYAMCAILNLPKSQFIFTVSEFSKKDIIKTFNINENKVIVTPNGHEHFTNQYYTGKPALKSKYLIYENYYFTIGGDAPSKNSEILLKIFVKNPDMNLIFVGVKNLNSSYLYNKYRHYKNIKFLPYIEQKDLVGLYINAKAFIFPSIYEGFGIPLLEAMKCNCPILCSNSSCLPEVARDAALYFNPQNPNDILDKVKKIEALNVKKNLLKKAFLQLQRYSWKSCAQKVYNGYNNVSYSKF